MIERPVAALVAVGLIAAWYITMSRCFDTPKPKYK